MSKPKPKHMTKAQKVKTKHANKVPVRKGKIKATVRKKKPPVPTFNCNECREPFTDRKLGTWVGENPRWTCLECAKPKKSKPQKEVFPWYVLQCEPGFDRRVKKDLLRRLRIESMEHLVKKVVVPSMLKEVISEEPGEKVASGWEVEAEAARTAAIRKARELAGMRDGEVGPDGASAVPGYRWTTSLNHDKGYGYNWTVRKRPENPKAARKVVRAKKFPGYLLVNAKWDKDLDLVVGKVKYQWGFLLRPVVNNARVVVGKYLNGRYWWKLRHPETNEVIDCFPRKRRSHMGYETKGDAKHAGELAKAAWEEFRPTAVKDREAAELLISEKAIGQIVKDKEERDKVVNVPKVGDTVILLKPHPFAGTECEVVEVVNKTEGKLRVTFTVFGTKVEPIPVEAWQCERKAAG